MDAAWNWFSGKVISKVQDSFYNKLAKDNENNEDKNKNRYEKILTNTNAGVALTWIENKPGIGDLLKSLGNSRGSLYKILTSSHGDQVSSKCFPQILAFDRLIASFFFRWKAWWLFRVNCPLTIQFPTWCQALRFTTFTAECSILLRHTWETNFVSDLQMVRIMCATGPFARV